MVFVYQVHLLLKWKECLYKLNNCSHPGKAIMSVSMLSFVWGIEVHLKDICHIQHNKSILKMINSCQKYRWFGAREEEQQEEDESD
jgi:hypothetical protein